MAAIDLLLLHPPSVYDFREEAILYGPVSDLIPSSPVFEMYPLGFLTIAAALEAKGVRVRIVNLALRMMNDKRFAKIPKIIETEKGKDGRDWDKINLKCLRSLVSGKKHGK